jgi:hypothetical protein
VPIEGVPVEFGGYSRDSNWGNYKKSLCEAIRTNNFSSNDVRLAIVRANESAVNAWSACVASSGLHFWAEQTTPDDSQFVVLAKYVAAGPPYVTKANGKVVFQPKGKVRCDGDTIRTGTQIGAGGLVLNCTRLSKDPVSITVSTKHGPGIIRLRAKIPDPIGPPACGALETQIFSSTGGNEAHPRVEVDVPAGYKIIGGGALVNWAGGGNLLTASYPENERKWVAMSKDHRVSDPATITGWAIALHDPDDEWEVTYVSSTGSTEAHPTSRASLPDGYAMTGGGARVNWGGEGNLLTASYPVDTKTWEARSKDHELVSPASVTTYVIGLKPRRCVGARASEIFSAEGGVAAHPMAAVNLPTDFVLTSGGARVNWTEPGNLLTASFPAGATGWEARAKDHDVSSPASVTVYVIGIRR